MNNLLKLSIENLAREVLKMTLDEAIEYYIKVATQRAIADEEMGVNDNSKWNETKFMTKKESEQIIADNQQLAEWLTELKEAKRLLKSATGIIKDVDCNEDYLCDECEYRSKCDGGFSFYWRYADEALALIGDDVSNDDERLDNLYKEAEKISNNADDTKEEE